MATTIRVAPSTAARRKVSSRRMSPLPFGAGTSTTIWPASFANCLMRWLRTDAAPSVDPHRQLAPSSRDGARVASALHLQTKEEACRVVVAAGQVAGLGLVAQARGEAGVAVQPPGQAGFCAENPVMAVRAGIVAPVRAERRVRCEVGTDASLRRQPARIKDRAALCGGSRALHRRGSAQADRRAAFRRPSDIRIDGEAGDCGQTIIVQRFPYPAKRKLAVELLAEIEFRSTMDAQPVRRTLVAGRIHALVIGAAADLHLREWDQGRRNCVAAPQSG